MTHEEFLGVPPGTVLANEDRQAVERTFSWQAMQAGEELRKLGRAILKAIGLTKESAT